VTDSPLASSEWAGFLHAMRFAPGEDTHRLAAADWLQDTGRPELEAWADFVRSQIEAATERAGAVAHPPADYCDCYRCRAERRATALFDRWGPHWFLHGFGGADGRMTPPAAKDYHRGFPGSMTFTIENFKVHQVPRQVGAYFARMPLWSVWLNLRDTTFETGIVGLNCWRMCVTVGTAEKSPYMRVRAEIETYPHRPNSKLVRASRILSANNQFDRAVRGAVRQALAERTECFRAAPAGHESGGVG